MSGKFTKRSAKGAAGLLATGTFGLGALGVGISIAPAASAAQGCGQGYHIQGDSCVVNIPGPGARFVAGTNCWYNDNNDYRCPPGG